MMKNLMRLFCLMMLLFACQAIYPQTTGSKSEIKAFERNNKVLLKNLKKQYKAKVDVEQNELGMFYIVIKMETDGSVRYLLADESGALLYPDAVDSYKAGKDFFWIGQIQGETKKWGIIDMKGKSVLPTKYYTIWYVREAEIGEYSGVWHPANKEVFISVEKRGELTINTFVSRKDNKVLHTYEGDIKQVKGYFWEISKSSGSIANNSGLYTRDGEEIFPQEYTGFSFWGSTGLVKSLRKKGTVDVYGAKMIKPGLADTVVPALFNDVRWNSSIMDYECRIHRGDPYKRYDPAATYDFSYKDRGEELYDAGRFQEVITYYEGEGYGKVWGDYYMGLSANEIAKNEVAQMNMVINTLNSSNNYYKPLEEPERYKFDSGTIMTMYLSAISYFERYINCKDIPDDDLTKVEARKLRGELVTLKNNFSKKTDEYTTAYSNALSRNTERKVNEAQQQIRQQQAADAIVDGIFNLLK